MQRKSQGEIFGIALLFVVVIIGLMVYSQIKALEPDTQAADIQEKKYKIVAEGTLNSMLKISTGCFVERGANSLLDLVNYCIENSFGGDDDPIFKNCNGGIESCTEVKKLFNKSLITFFNNSNLGLIPYNLKMDIPRDDSLKLSNLSINNFDTFEYRGNPVIDIGGLRKAKFKKVSSGLRTWPTAKGNIEVELDLYYR